MPTFRRAFLTGLLVLTPLVLTGWVIYAIFQSIDGRLGPLLLRVPVLAEHLPDLARTAMAVALVFIVITSAGLFANNLIGRAVLSLLERAISRIPMVKGIYNATKDLSTVMFGERRSAFRKVVVFEYPRRGLYSIGFVTMEAARPGEASDMIHVFLPTTPNPTSGFFLMVPRKDAIELPIPIEDGIKLVMSGGAVATDQILELLGEAIDQTGGALRSFPES